jgi:hypothetical protein
MFSTTIGKRSVLNCSASVLTLVAISIAFVKLIEFGLFLRVKIGIEFLEDKFKDSKFSGPKPDLTRNPLCFVDIPRSFIAPETVFLEVHIVSQAKL